jgi:hypothetical protein
MVFLFLNDNSLLSTDTFYVTELSEKGKKEVAEKYYGKLYLPETFGFAQVEYYLDEKSFNRLRKAIAANEGVTLSTRKDTFDTIFKYEINIADVV